MIFNLYVKETFKIKKVWSMAGFDTSHARYKCTKCVILHKSDHLHFCAGMNHYYFWQSTFQKIISFCNLIFFIHYIVISQVMFRCLSYFIIILLHYWHCFLVIYRGKKPQIHEFNNKLVKHLNTETGINKCK